MYAVARFIAYDGWLHRIDQALDGEIGPLRGEGIALCCERFEYLAWTFDCDISQHSPHCQ